MVRSEIDKVLFDTATLDSGDLFALLLLAPATFSMVNKLGSATGMITVTLSKEVARSPKATAPIYVDASKSAFDPKDIQLASGQGRVFRCYRGGAMVARDRKTARTFRRLRGSRGRSGNGELGFARNHRTTDQEPKPLRDDDSVLRVQQKEEVMVSSWE